MIRRNYFSHFTKGTKTGPCERISRQGYRYGAENIGEAPNPDRMFRAWMNNSGHRGNILDRRYREIGMGATRKDARKTMFTVDFGTRF